MQAGEHIFLGQAYASLPADLRVFVPPGSLLRDSITLWICCTIGGLILYFGVASLIFFTYFDRFVCLAALSCRRTLLQHPKILPNQIGKEINMAFWQAFWGT